MSDPVWPHRQQPIRLLCPLDSPSKNTGVGCHFLLQCMRVKSESEVTQSCLTLCDPMDCSLPGSSVQGIFQARVLEWVAISFSNAPNIGAPQYTRQALTDIKGEIDSNTIVGDFNTPLTPMDRSSKHKINKETHILNDTLDKMDLIDIFRTFHSNAEEYTFFSSARGTFSRIDHILGHKSSLSKFKKI